MMKHDDNGSKSSQVKAFVRLCNRLTWKKKNQILIFSGQTVSPDVLEIALNKIYDWRTHRQLSLSQGTSSRWYVLAIETKILK